MSRTVGGYVRALVYRAHLKRVWNITFLLKRSQCDCDSTCYLLKKLFNQDEVVGGKLSSKRVSLKSNEP